MCNFDKPSVSIIIPNYNYAHLIEETLESVKNQSYTDFECIIVDDGSTDNSLEVLTEFIALDERFKLLCKTNGGLSSARNEGLKLAQGDYIAFLDSDDLWKVDKLKNQIEAVKTKNVDVVFSSIENFNSEENLDVMYYEEGGLDKYAFLANNPIPGGSSNFLMKRKVFESVGYYNNDLRSSEDLHYFFRIAFNDFKFGFIDSVDVKIRKHAGSMQTNFLKMYFGKLYCFELCFELMLSSNNVNKSKLEKAYYRKFQNMLWTARSSERTELIKYTYIRFRKLIGFKFYLSAVFFKNFKYDLILYYNLWRRKS